MFNLNEADCMNTNSNCIPYETTIKPAGLAMAYVPYQKICGYYEPMEALKKGTIFPALYKPYK